MLLQEKDSCYYHFVPNLNKKILSFDLDSTLIETKSGDKFPKDAKDWKFMYPNIKSELEKLQKNYNLVIFTNQKGLSDKFKMLQFNTKLNAIYTELGFDITTFIATEDDIYRKPHTSMYKLFLELSKFKDAEIDDLIYCGDAAGRKYTDGTKDFSISDLYFAFNIDAIFKLPEEVFKQPKKEGKIIDLYDTLDLKKYITKDPLPKEASKLEIRELVLLVGLPACGKSTITQKYYSNYRKINMDTIKNKKKMMDMFTDYINHGYQIIVDNTNTKKEQRKQFIDIAKENKYTVKIILQDIPFEICNHLNNYRVEQVNASKIAIVTYRTMLKYFEEPTEDEGKIIKLNKIYDFKDNNIFDFKFS
jgi:bifunctional polynucleotide phosphatase/kinase